MSGRVSDPAHRLDVALEPLVAEDKLAATPHGLVGQSVEVKLVWPEISELYGWVRADEVAAAARTEAERRPRGAP